MPTNGIIAGLGISGLAVAFASKETLSNVSGAGILAIDRPFTRGDWIVAEAVHGIVEHVGMRSTRVRMAEDTVRVELDLSFYLNRSTAADGRRVNNGVFLRVLELAHLLQLQLGRCD